MDTRNTFTQHLIVGIFALGLTYMFNALLSVEWPTAFGRVSFILLFLTLLIGPAMKLRKPIKASSPLEIPWTWRGELGIWFFLTGLVHFIIIWSERPFTELIRIGGSGFALANLMGLVALLLALLLTAASFRKVILYLGVESWKWLHSMTYVVFYLISGHYMYFQFFSTYGEVGPDWFGYMAVIMTLLIIVLQFAAFIKTVAKNHQKQNSV